MAYCVVDYAECDGVAIADPITGNCVGMIYPVFTLFVYLSISNNDNECLFKIVQRARKTINVILDGKSLVNNNLSKLDSVIKYEVN